MKTKLIYPLVVSALIAATYFAIDLIDKNRADRALGLAKRIAESRQSITTVRVTNVTHSPKQRQLTVNGETRPAATVTLFSKASGYVLDISVDRGSIVKKGQILAQIDSPETEKAFKATVSDFNYKRAAYLKAKALGKKKLESTLAVEAARADFESAQARMESVMVLKDNQAIRAPFDGIVSERFVDAGALIQASVGAKPVVTVSRFDVLKAIAYVNQRDAPYVRVGTPASITPLGEPGLEIKAKVSRVSRELDYSSKALFAEIDIDNSKDHLVAGGFVQVTLTIDVPPSLMVPSEALIVEGENRKVALVDSDNHIKIRTVTVIDTNGRFVALKDGVKEGDVVVLHQGNSVAEGQTVAPVSIAADNSAKGNKTPGEEVLRRPSATTDQGQKKESH